MASTEHTGDNIQHTVPAEHDTRVIPSTVVVDADGTMVVDPDGAMVADAGGAMIIDADGVTVDDAHGIMVANDDAMPIVVVDYRRPYHLSSGA